MQQIRQPWVFIISAYYYSTSTSHLGPAALTGEADYPAGSQRYILGSVRAVFYSYSYSMCIIKLTGRRAGQTDRHTDGYLCSSIHVRYSYKATDFCEDDCKWKKWLLFLSFFSIVWPWCSLDERRASKKPFFIMTSALLCDSAIRP